MAAREPDWVPGDAWLAPGYAEWAPPAALRGAVACLWASVVPDGADRTTLVLPDACSDLIWEQGTGGYVAGPDTGPVRTVTRAGTVIVGVRFRPSAGGTALGLPLSEVRDRRVALADLLPAVAGRPPCCATRPRAPRTSPGSWASASASCAGGCTPRRATARRPCSACSASGA